MPLYICDYCDYNSKTKERYYRHLHTHLTFENISKFDPNEMELCMFYYNKIKEQGATYYQNNKDKIKEQGATYYQNNKDKIKEYYQNNNKKIKEYRRNNKDKIKLKKKERNAIYYQNNKDKIKEQRAQYRLKNKLEETELTIIDVSDDE